MALHSAARSYLEIAPASPEQLRRWATVDPRNALRANGATSRTAIQTVPERRRRAYGGRITELEEVLSITRANALDLDALATALDRANARERRLALVLVERHELASEGLIAAVRRRVSDVDAEARSLAAAMIRDRGW